MIHAVLKLKSLFALSKQIRGSLAIDHFFLSSSFSFPFISGLFQIRNTVQ